jgi:flagellar biosynthesis anti-sigma factor FlgM
MDNISSITGSTNNPVPPVTPRVRGRRSERVGSASQDSIELSSAARDLQRAEEAARASGELRFDVVSRLRSAVNGGNYRIDPQAVAQAMVNKGEQAE